MDEMKLKLSSELMKNLISRIISTTIYRKTGYKVDVRLNDLNVSFIDGDTSISTSVRVNAKSDEFIKIVKSIDI